MSGRVVEILLVEDNPGDAELTREGLRMARIPSRLHVVENGLDALAFVRREGARSDAPRPQLILLDLNLPLMDGREVLAELKSDGQLRNIPIAILTSSEAEQDIARSYDLHANCYLIKPVDLQKFFEVVRDIATFWLGSVRLPPEESAS